ncbi:MAG: transcriptional regulator, partial [Actinomycetota bacterium]
APKRLAAMGLLAAAKRIEFGYLRDHLQLSDSDLSKQLRVLTDAGYVTSKRTGKGRTRASWFSITPEGAAALDRHATALQGLLQPDAPAASADQPTATAKTPASDIDGPATRTPAVGGPGMAAAIEFG